MSAIITNFTAPADYEALKDYYDGEGSNIDMLFSDCIQGYTTWSIWETNKVGDVVFFCCAATSVTKIAHARVEAKKIGNAQIITFADREYSLYKEYAGKLLAIGVVAQKPYEYDGRYYVDIIDLKKLTKPIPYSSFKHFITLNPGGTITKLEEEQEKKLFGLIDGDYETEPLKSETVVDDPAFSEGKKIVTYSTKYERNPRVRAAYLAQSPNPYQCAVSGFDYEKTYGNLGKFYIEVHHIKPLSSIGTESEIDPQKDLVSLCSNCHRMIHRSGILTVDELKERIKIAAQGGD